MSSLLLPGLRKGELFAVRKQDLDLEERLLYVRRSHRDDTVKGKKALVLPIPSPLVQYLRDAINRSPSEYVFPDARGERGGEHAKMEQVYRQHPEPRRNRRRISPHLPALCSSPRPSGPAS